MVNKKTYIFNYQICTSVHKLMLVLLQVSFNFSFIMVNIYLWFLIYNHYVIFYYDQDILFILTGKKNPIRAPVTLPTRVIAPITPELKPVVNQVIILNHFVVIYQTFLYWPVSHYFHMDYFSYFMEIKKSFLNDCWLNLIKICTVFSSFLPSF